MEIVEPGAVVSVSNLGANDVEVKINNKWELSHVMTALCCPCVIIGHMDSMVKRENERTISCFPSLPMGSNGLRICLKYSLFVPFCWPCPIGVISYVRQQKRNVRIAYNGRDEDFCQELSVCCMWPWSLLELNNSFERKEAEELLFFDWETKEDMNKDRKKQPPPTRTIRVAIVGPPRCGKSQFAHKLLHAANSHIASTSNSLQVGYRPLAVTPTSVDFLEVWDVPGTNISPTELSAIVDSSDYIAFTFDIVNIESFLSMREIYNEFRSSGQLSGKPIVCVGTKLDGVWSMRSLHSSLDSSVQFEKDRLHDQLLAIGRQASEARRWAQANGVQYVEVSSQANFNIVNAAKCFVDTISAPNEGDKITTRVE